ncbi:hypothetical protein IIA79_02335 [bacterium]|nr:hypothetical protein [bacterium]
MRNVFIRYRSQVGIFLAFALGFALAGVVRPGAARAIDLGDIIGDIIKVGAIKLVVDQFDNELNNLINKLMNNNDAATNAATKVVLIVSPIGNKHVGAAQVVGPQEAVDKVGAVVQLETSFNGEMFRIDVMIPIEGTDPTDFNRVPGVGVSAVIDVRI